MSQLLLLLSKFFKLDLIAFNYFNEVMLYPILIYVIQSEFFEDF